MKVIVHSRVWWSLIILAFLVRFGVACFAPTPGISDSTHYYNLARNVSEGRGFVIDYIWNYYSQPDAVTHPEDYWMPLAAVAPAIMLRLFPDNLIMALLPSVLFGTAVVALTYALAKAAALSDEIALVAMALMVFMPEMILNSARTDTTISYVFYIGMVALCWHYGLQRHPRWWIAAGVFAGLAHLTRQDTLLLAFVFGVLIAYFIIRREKIQWRWFVFLPITWIVVLLPWMLRNYSLYGVLLAGGASRTIFMTSFIDQFTYGRTLDFNHWWSWGLSNIVVNIGIQTLANVRMLFRLPTDILSLFGLIGMGLWAMRRQQKIVSLFVIPVLFLALLFLFYSFVTPFHTQGGSFKKSAMLLLPFVAVAAAYGISHFFSLRAMFAVCFITMALLAMTTIDLVRADFVAASSFDNAILAVKEVLNDVGDVNGDGKITVMTQDPFILNYHGFHALMIPSDTRDMILEAAHRYNVDYILIPAARVGLDDLYNNKTQDSRLVWMPATSRNQLLRVVPQIP